MKNLSLVKWVQWKKKRRHSFIGCIIVGMIVGMDYSFMFTTLYHYLKDVIKTEKPELYYGLIIAAYNVSSSLFGTIVGRWLDKYRKFKVFTNITLILQIIGIVLYIIPNNVVYPFVGRLISGVGDPYVGICSGEVVRIYNQQEGSSALWWLTACYSFGYMIGPVVVIVFKNIDFHIGGLHVNQLNSVAIFLASLLIFALIVVNFLIHDCSAMIDLKMYLKENAILDTNDNTKSVTPNEKSSCNVSEATCLLDPSSTKKIKHYSKEDTPVFQKEKNLENSDRSVLIDSEDYISINDNSENQSIRDESNILLTRSTWEVQPIGLVFYGLLTNVNTLLIFTSTFLLAYSLFAVDVIIPLLTEVVLKWSITTLALIFAANGIAYFVMIMITWEFCVTDRAVYHMLILSIMSLILTFGIMILLNVLKNNAIASAILMISCVILWAVAWIAEDMVIKCTLAKMVPSSCQSFTEALRSGASRLSMILAAITVPLFVPYLKKWCIGIIVINSLLLIAFLMRRKSFLLVREMEFRPIYPDSTKRNVPFITSDTYSSTA